MRENKNFDGGPSKIGHFSHISQIQTKNVVYHPLAILKCLPMLQSPVCVCVVKRPSGSNRFDERFCVKTVKHTGSIMV